MSNLKWKDFNAKSEAPPYQVYLETPQKWRAVIKTDERRGPFQLSKHVALTACRKSAKEACQKHFEALQGEHKSKEPDPEP